jgi:hypothetical protein
MILFLLVTIILLLAGVLSMLSSIVESNNRAAQAIETFNQEWHEAKYPEG